MFKNKVFAALLLLVSTTSYSLFAQSSAFSANRRTAIRYLQLAKQYASEKNWNAADSQAVLGLAYDESIADLWYIRAASQMGLGTARSKVIPLVTKSLSGTEWVDYNRDGARILYADILCHTLRYDEALIMLDSSPFLFSADAEYIRAKCFYNLGGEYITKAREKIDAARRIYPTDVRFARLFFQYEYVLNKARLFDQEDGLEPLTRKIADAFISQLSLYKSSDSELELFASIFATGEKQKRMLRSFKARNLSSPLYGEAALRVGIISQNEALDRFLDYADKVIDLSVLQGIVPLITEEKPKKDLIEYLNAYNGTITADTDGDLTTNLTVSFNRGRPAVVSYDQNQDDEKDWTAECDFGVPMNIHLAEGGVDVHYENWPYIWSASLLDEDGSSNLEFMLAGESLSWSPFEVNPDQIVKESLALDFFFPSIYENIPQISAEELLHSSTGYTIPSRERKDALIKVTVLDGVAQMARYFVGDVMYAQAQFENGIPVFRMVDMDGDGLFETTETYGFSKDLNQNVISTADEMQIITNLFGSPASGTGFFVRMIQIDSNGDTIPDFTEEYVEGQGKISSWDTNGDGLWNTRYIKRPLSKDGILREEALFHQPLSQTIVTIYSENGQPVKVSDGQKDLAVTKAGESNLYWLGEISSPLAAEKVLEIINQKATQGVSLIVSTDEGRFLAVKFANMIFAQKMSDSEVPDSTKKEEVKNENNQ